MEIENWVLVLGIAEDLLRFSLGLAANYK